MAESKISASCTRTQKTNLIAVAPSTGSNSFNTSATTTFASTSGFGKDEIYAKITTLFFDLDNTLMSTRSGDLKACRKLAEVLENQFKFTKEESTTATQTYLKSFRRCPDNSQTSLDSWRTYLWRESLPSRHKQLAEQIYPKWLQLRYRYLAIQTEYVQLLKHFRSAGYLLALITNGPSNAQWEKIQKLHISQYFDCVLVSSDLPWEKPNPNIFYAACNFLGVKPEQCAMIGDKLETDIKGGRLANLGATFWMPLNSTEVDLTDVEYAPDVILRNLLDMLKYFPAINGSSSGNSVMTGGNSILTTASASGAISAAATCSNSRRRCSQFSTTISTCDSSCDLHNQHHHNHHQHLHQRLHQEQPNYYYKHHQQAQQQQQQQRKYRRGGSLPAMECLNSETENSSDSIFSN